ncbi:MAG: DUF4129 domain-containing protein [Chloroflexi bacterium]|nr:DUF4129 domain-containing protein [Chloroflexota bacterium]
MLTKISARLSSKLSLRLWSETALHLLLAMHAVWLSAWYRQLAAPQAFTWAMGLVWLLVLAGGYWLSRGLEKLQNQPILQRAAALLWMAGVILLTAFLLIFLPLQEALPMQRWMEWVFSTTDNFNRVLAHLVIFGLSAWRALDLGQRVFSRELIEKEFQLGSFALLFFGLIYSSEASSALLIRFAAFLFLGLLALSIARIAEQEAVRGGRLPRFASLWPALLFGLAALVSLAALLISTYAGVPIASVLAQAALLILSGLALLIILILSPVLALILEAAYRFGQKIFGDVPNLIPYSAAQQAADQMLDTSQQALDMVSTQNGRPVLFIAAVLFLIVLVFLSLRFRYYRRQLRAEEQTDRVRPARASRAERQSSSSAPAWRWISPRKAFAAARIRLAYARLIELSERLGRPRPPAATPAEFLPTLQQLWPDHSADLALMTQAYQKVRYGQIPETQAEVDSILQAWKQIQKSGSQMLKRMRAKK